MIRMQQCYPGRGMSLVTLVEVVLGRSFQSLIGQLYESLPCRLTPAQAQTVLNAVLAKTTARPPRVEGVTRPFFLGDLSFVF